MGCGAVACGNNSSIQEQNLYSQKIILKIIPHLTHAKDFISSKQFYFFTRQIKVNPLKFRLKVSNKLIAKEQIDPEILSKWKVILYCLDSQNSQYNNCLGQKIKKKNGNIQDHNEFQQQQIEMPDDEDDYNFTDNDLVIPHKQFSQIEKDIDRTCDLSETNKKTFQKILKRITNHFPTMGYTQGINFIIGYLLMIGYSQFDAFWMFVHIAINKRYLLLGLFEDGFPLSEIYKVVFKNILKRSNTVLYQHFYQSLNIDQSAWVFKWFITYFIYSFPLQMIKHVFDIVIQLGGIGLIIFAIAITEQLSEYLLQEHDVGQISIFFKSLKDVNVFNHYISIKKVIQRVYTLQIKKQDFDGINVGDKNFYMEYILANLSDNQYYQFPRVQVTLKKEQITNLQIKSKKKVLFSEDTKIYTKSIKLLNQWYEKLIFQRFNFIVENQKVKNKQKKKTERISIQNDITLIKDQILEKEKDIKSPDKDKQQKSVNSNNNSFKDSAQIKNYTIPSTGYSLNKKSSQVNVGDNVSQIDEMWDQEDKNSSVSKNLSGHLSSRLSQQSRTQNGFNIKIGKISFQDQLDKLAATQSNTLGKGKDNYINKVSSIFNGQKYSSFKPKINNFQIQDKNKGNSLTRAAQNIISNISVTENSQYQSSNSQTSKISQKQKKNKQNGIHSRNYVKNNKFQKSIQNQLTVAEMKKSMHDLNEVRSSSRDSYIDPRNSFCISNQSIQEEMKNNEGIGYSMKVFESHRQRMTTQQDILTNSLHDSHINQNNSKGIQSSGSQIQIFQAHQVFKKKNRVSSKINGAVGNSFNDIAKIQKLSHTISDAKIHQKSQKSSKTIALAVDMHLNYEQSYESIFVPSQGKKSNRIKAEQQLRKCEVESVK